MEREKILFLNQLVKSLGDAEENLEENYERKDHENFNKSKKIMLRIQKEISNILK